MLLNYTTTISAQKTVSEIMASLVMHGAKAILVDYDDAGLIESLSFRLATVSGDIGIRLPIDPDAVLRVMERQGVQHRYCTRQRSVQVAWRIAKDWVKAQMALVETEMVRMEQVFLPYWITPSGNTLYQLLVSNKFQLPEGEKRGKGD
jgi:hypothetical protein